MATQTTTFKNNLEVLGNLTVGGTTSITSITQTDLTTTGNTILGNAVTDTLAINGATTITTTSASGLTVGRLGATTPVLKINAATTTVATGIEITGAASLSGVAVAAIGGTNESLTIDAKGSGTITLNGTATGGVTVTRALTTSAGISNTGTISTTALTATAGITSSGATGAGIGYATGAGGTVTQITSRTTGVTISKLSGTIQTDTSSLAGLGTAKFTVTNTTVAIGDVVVTAIQSGSNSGGTHVSVTTVANGSFEIAVINNNAAAGTAETGAIIINFAVIKAVAA